MKQNIFIVTVIALLLSACGSASDQAQASETAFVSTMIVGMMSAIPPVATLTDTPAPSETPLPTSTETQQPLIEISPTPSADPCTGPLFANPVAASDAGKVDNGASVLIKNTTKASITVSLYLSKNKFGQCGFVSYVIAPSQSVSIVNELPYGCYSAFAYINDPKKPSTASGGPACITGPDKTTFTVYADKIKVTGP